MHVITYTSDTVQDERIRAIFVTGQSLGNGSSPGQATLTTVQPYRNTMPSAMDGILTGLHEPVYSPESGAVETIISSCLNLLSRLIEPGTPSGAALTGFAVARNGAAMSVIDQGATGPYANSLAIMAHLRTLSRAGVEAAAVLLVHGEADHQLGTTGYDALVGNLAADYDTDLRGVTGQAGAVPLFLCQTSSWTHYGDATSLIPVAQRAASHTYAGVHLVGPKYHLPYVDGVHLMPAGYRQLGEHYAVALYDQIWGAGWQPLEPVEVSRVGAVITARFHVPSGGGLALDTTRVSNPGNYGFEYTDSTGSASIASVALAGADTVTVTLNTTPTGANKRLRYAYTGVAGNDGGPDTGPRGCLRDGDTRYASRYGYALYNWAVHFEEAVS